MSLYRQLVILISALSLTTLAGTLWINFGSTRAFLEEQLISHAQDTATALGLTLSATAVESGAAARVAAVDAVFDRGYYRHITVSDASGTVLIERDLAVQIEGVPAWFIKNVQLRTPAASAFIMQGWRQAGLVSVSSHPGYAYRKLWQETRQTALWFVGIAIALLLGGGYTLHHVLAPLRQIERQARALVRREYIVQEHLPSSRELRSVVEAMNALIGHLREIFESQARVVEELRTVAYRDALTGLGNRRYFERQMTARLATSEEALDGVVVLVELDGLHGTNVRQGYAAGDALLTEIAESVQQVANDVSHGLACRLGGATFALLLPATAVTTAGTILDKLIQRIQARCEGAGFNVSCLRLGATAYHHGETLSSIYGRADTAMRGIGAETEQRWHILQAGEVELAGRRQWEQAVAEAIRAGSVQLMQQAVLRLPESDQVMHREILVRLRLPETEELVTAGAFMPAAESMGLIIEIDKLVTAKVCHLLADERAERCSYAINLSPVVLHDKDFQDWFMAQIRLLELPQRRRLFVELSEPRAVVSLPQLKRFAERLHAAGIALGLDHYGRSFSDLAHLHALKPAYVKLDSAYSRELEHDKDARFLVQALCSAVSVLGTEVIAEAVQDVRQRELLQELGIGGVQGFALQAPESLPDTGRAQV